MSYLFLVYIFFLYKSLLHVLPQTLALVLFGFYFFSIELGIKLERNFTEYRILLADRVL